jgi:hypothetical protein
MTRPIPEFPELTDVYNILAAIAPPQHDPRHHLQAGVPAAVCRGLFSEIFPSDCLFWNHDTVLIIGNVVCLLDDVDLCPRSQRFGAKYE